jgi:hypothetical protein
MATGDALQRHLDELRRRERMIPQRMCAISQGATLRAVEEATDHTSPNGDEKARGVGAVSGELAAHWATDSQAVPTVIGLEYHTNLANNVQYVSYVNDGHRMDKHFVPGLMFNPETGLLDRVDPEIPGAGMVVGTKTAYIPGVYMKEKGVDKFRDVAQRELRCLMREVFGP